MTRRLLILIAVTTGLWGLVQLGVGQAVGANGLVVAVAGIALLAALTLGSTFERFGVPAITAYALVGLIVGLFVGAYARTDMRTDMHVHAFCRSN